MQEHRIRARQAIFIIGLLLLIVAAVLINASITAGQGPSTVYLPLISTGTLCDPVARSEIVFIDDPGTRFIIEPANNGCPLQAYRIQDRFLYESPQGSEARWTDWGTPSSIGRWWWMPRVQSWPGTTRMNIAMEVSGHNFIVRTSRW
jgi:hypothetical protein